MAMVVKNNMSAVRTLNTLNSNSNALQGSLAKVSSGMKINSAQDDASGYAISERMRVQIRSLDQANQNTQNGSSLMKTAEGAVSKTVEILKSLKEKAISAATDTNTDSDRVTIQKEIDQFIDQIDDNALVTFNGKYLVDGSKTQAGDATKTAMTNQSLATDTTGAKELTALKNRNNEELEISSTDYVTASFVKDGKTYTTKYQVGKTKLEDIFVNLNDVATKSVIGKNVFGAANTATGKSYSSIDEAAKELADADADALLAAVKGDAAGADLISAAKYLAKEANITDLKDATADGISATALSTTTLLTAAETALKDKIKENIENLEVTVTVKAGTANNRLAADSTVELKDGSATPVVLTTKAATAAQFTCTAANTEYTTTATVGAGNVDADDLTGIMDRVAAAADDVATATTPAYASVGAAIAGITTFTTGDAAKATGSDADVTIESTAVTDGKNATVAADDPEAEDYAKAYLLNKLVENNSAVGAEELVYASSNVGLAASGDMTSTANGESGLTVTAAANGLKGQVSGLAISITDSEGNVKKSANASLDAFSTTIFAANKSDDNALKFQVGATANLSITVGLADMRSEALGLKGSDGSKVSVATQAKANAAIATFDNALQKALDIQTTIGAVEARLDYTSSNLTTSSENVQAAESTIRDADMAKEMTNYTKNNVLLQAAQSMLAQANQNSSAVLSLLQ